MTINATVSAINTKLLLIIIALLFAIAGLGAKYVADQHQIAALMQAQADRVASQEAAAKAQDDAIRKELQRRADRAKEPSHFEFHSSPTK